MSERVWGMERDSQLAGEDILRAEGRKETTGDRVSGREEREPIESSEVQWGRRDYYLEGVDTVND